MNQAIAYSLAAASATVAGALVVVGGGAFSSLAMRRAISLAAGFLVAISLAGLLPEALARSPDSAGWIALAGFVSMHLLQHVVGRVAPHGAHGEGHAHLPPSVFPDAVLEEDQIPAGGVSAVASLGVLGALIVHTMIDGVAIASAQGGEARLGAMVFVGVLLHKFPEGLAVASLFLASGLGRTRAMLAAGALAAAIILGTLITNAFHPVGGAALGVSAGVTLYVGASSLLPEVRDGMDAGTIFTFLLGAVLATAARALTAGS